MFEYSKGKTSHSEIEASSHETLQKRMDELVKDVTEKRITSDALLETI